MEVTQVQNSINYSVERSIIWEMHLGYHGMDQTYTMKKGQDSIPIEKVESEKDLGVIIDKDLKFSEHINSKIKTANRNLGLIFRTFTYLDKEMFLNLFKSVVCPILEYASTVWSPVCKKDKIAIENVQKTCYQAGKVCISSTI